MQEPITELLKQRLKDSGSASFDEISEATGVAASFIRKFVYGSRNNPRIGTIQPLIDYFGLMRCAKRSKPTKAT